jgi:hypothetical protein
MEKTPQVDDKAASAPSCCTPTAKARWLNSRNVVIGALVVAGAALYFGWEALVAAGVASVILGVLPCLAMCALGLCMGRSGKKETATPTSASRPPEGGEAAPQSTVQT